MANRHEIFGGGQGHGQERLSPEPAQSVKVRARKGREIQILVISPLKMAIALASFFRIVWLAGGAPCNLVVPGGHWVVLGAARGLLGGYRGQTEGFRKFGKRCFLPPGTKSGGLGGSSPPF